ncbi:MAG: hypothetical protein JO027_15405 [Solirubrobacterales bacterium]|nr:hypothetical protein [Solirubrobacterales bacterium]
MSFFDEPEETRTAPRTAPRRRRSTGGTRRPGPATQQAILARRLVLAGIVVVAIILIAVLVNSCEVSARNSALKDYNNSVASLNAQSVNTGHGFFTSLSGPTGDPAALNTSLNQSWSDATNQLKQAKNLSVPDEVKAAQSNFVLALQMRADGMHNIASEIQPALQSQTAQDAVTSIASDMARFYASDVLYKDYTVPEVIGALRAAGITVGGLGGQQINAGQFLPSISWLDPQTIANTLKVSLPSSAKTSKPITPGLHGHQLNSVSVGGTQLQTGSTNSIPASPAPIFTLNFANTGQNTETNVICKVTIAGSNVNGQTTVPQTTAGESTSCQVTLNGIPAKGTHQMTATIVPVPGEKNIANNSLTFPVDFQ